jgi:hypothetical protein
VKDFFGNASTAEFKVKSSALTPSLSPRERETGRGQKFKCCDLNKFETENIKVEIAPCTLYHDIDFYYSMSKDTLPGKFSPIHTVHKTDVPLNANYSLSIKTKPVPDKLQSKATIVLLDGKNEMKDQKGDYKDGWVTTDTRYFGRFAVAVDTVAPSIKPRNILNGSNLSHAKMIAVTIADNLTGIKTYRGTVDGKWIAMQFEYKNAMLFYEFDEHVSKGKHTFVLEVTDGKNNVRTYKADFVR